MHWRNDPLHHWPAAGDGFAVIWPDWKVDLRPARLRTIGSKGAGSDAEYSQ
jgi:hypothetical protein